MDHNDQIECKRENEERRRKDWSVQFIKLIFRQFFFFPLYTSIAFISAWLLPPFDHAPCLWCSQTAYPRWLPTALARSSRQYKNIISWLTIINHPSLKPSSYEIFSHPLITNALLQQSTHSLSFPLKTPIIINIIIYLFPQALLIPLNAFTIPHIFIFMHCNKINNYSPPPLSLH